MVLDFAKWQIRVGGVLLFGASERPFNHPGDDLVDPIVPMPKDGPLWDGQILPFYVKLWNLTVPMCSILRHGHYRIDQIVPRVVQGPFRCSEKQHTSHTDLPFGKIGPDMGQNAAHALAWGGLLKNGAVAYTQWRFWRPGLLNAAPTLHTPVPGPTGGAVGGVVRGAVGGAVGAIGGAVGVPPPARTLFSGPGTGVCRVGAALSSPGRQNLHLV